MEGDYSWEEPQVGDWVLVNLPRSRWDHRRGILREIRQEPGEQSQGFVYLSWMLVRFPLKYLVKCVPSDFAAIWPLGNHQLAKRGTHALELKEIREPPGG